MADQDSDERGYGYEAKLGPHDQEVALYPGERIPMLPGLSDIIKAYTKAMMVSRRSDVLEFSREFFANLSRENPEGGSS